MRMGAKKREFSQEFKRNAVQLVLAGKRPRSEIARELGVRSSLLYVWQRKLAPASVQDSQPENVSEEQRRIRQLERENATLKEERDILKKATAFFAKEQH